MILRNERGQHTAEFALLIGLAAVAAVSMQLIVRRSVQNGLQRASDIILPPPSQDEKDHNDSQRELLVKTSNAVDETGHGQTRRINTRVRTSVVGHSVNEDVRLTGGGN